MSIRDDKTRLRRRELLVAAGEDAAHWLERAATSFHGATLTVRFLKHSRALDELVIKYADRVSSFKSRHDYAPDELINNYKIAAITVHLLINEDLGALFSVKPSSVMDSLPFTTCKALFVYRAAGIIMQVPKASMVAHDAFDRDMLHSIAFGGTVSEEWLICLMQAYGRSFGTIAVNS